MDYDALPNAALQRALQSPPGFTMQGFVMNLQTEAWLTFPQAGVSLGPKGEVKIDPKANLDETARQFWNAVAHVRGQPEPFPTPVAQGAPS